VSSESRSRFKEKKYYLFNPDSLNIRDWRQNDEGKWRDHLKRMIRNEVKEVRYIVDLFMDSIDEIYIVHLPQLPTYTEHYMTHSRNVAQLALKLMELNPNSFDEKDVLIICLSALMHDLGQYNPKSSSGEQVREEAEKGVNSLRQIFDEIIKSFDERVERSANNFQEYRNIFKGEKFKNILFNVAMYHEKIMPFNNDYKMRFKELRRKGYADKEIRKITLDRALKSSRLRKDEIEHYVGLAAIFQLADALDVQRFRETTMGSVKMRIAAHLKELGELMEIKEVDDDLTNNAIKAITHLNSISHLLKDLLISKVEIERRETSVHIQLNELAENNRGNVSSDIDIALNSMKDYIKEFFRDGEPDNIFVEIIKSMNRVKGVKSVDIDKKKATKLFQRLKKAAHEKTRSYEGSLNDLKRFYFDHLRKNYIVDPLLGEFFLVKPDVMKALKIESSKIYLEIGQHRRIDLTKDYLPSRL